MTRDSMSCPGNSLVIIRQSANAFKTQRHLTPEFTSTERDFWAMSSSVDGGTMWANECGSVAVFVPSMLIVKSRCHQRSSDRNLSNSTF